jgi:carbon storage regulator
MLVIRRRAGESFLIGADVEVEVLEITSSQVKIGIRAPKQVTVLRREIYLTQQQNRAASLLIPSAAMNLLPDSLKNPPSKPISAL